MKREFDIRTTSYSEEEFKVSADDFKIMLKDHNRQQLRDKFGIVFKKFINETNDEFDNGTYVFTIVDSKKLSMLSIKHGISGSTNTITNVCQRVHNLL